MNFSMDFFVTLYFVALVAIAWNGAHEEWSSGLPKAGVTVPVIVAIVATIGMMCNI